MLADCMEIIDNIITSIYNFLARIIFFFSFRKRWIVGKNKVFKNKHKGQRCFILLNGPSIKECDLSLLKNEKTFVCNYFYKSNLNVDIKPDYYLLFDELFFKDENRIEENILARYPNTTIIESIWGYKNNKIKNNCYYVDHFHLPTSFRIAHNISSISSGFQTVAFHAITAAIYMGFKEIYILGLDFEPSPFTHFYDGEVNRKYYTPKEYWCYSSAQHQAEYLNKFATKKDVSIYNVNKNSFIRSFSFVDYLKIFNKN